MLRIWNSDVAEFHVGYLLESQMIVGASVVVDVRV